MNCELAQERIALAAYGELPDDAAHELEQHLSRCESCRKELRQVEALQHIMELSPVIEPPPNLLVRARMRLEESLDAIPERSWISRIFQSFTSGVARLRTAPIAASVLLLAGMAAGGFGGYRYASMTTAAKQKTILASIPSDAIDSSASNEPVEVANVSSIERMPNSEVVEVRYNRLLPQRVEGSLDDPKIRELLMLASEHSTNLGIRNDSVQLLVDECRAGHACNAGSIRDALMATLLHDKSPEVRQKALEGLQPYIAQDMRVRDVVLESLLSDSDPEFRAKLINLLVPVEGDSSVRRVLSTVASQDRNPQVRVASRKFLSQVPEIQ
jgi:HEAT repeats/Putative zinc-finger